MQHMRLFLLATAIPSLCAAAAITDIAVTNQSTANFVTDTGTRLREFRTAADTPASATLSGTNTLQFTNRFAWMSGHRVDPGGPTVALINNNLVSYTLAFTVEDPTNIGYQLSFDTVFRGYLTTAWQANSGTGISQVFAAGTLMNANFDSGSGFGGIIGSLATDIEVASATDVNPLVNLLVARNGSYAAGNFVGTRTFQLRFSSVGANTIGAMQNFNAGESNVRFGLDPTSAGFDYASYPGLDGEDASTHGHFITVTAQFRDGAGGEVPEPSSALLFLLGAAGLICLPVKWSEPTRLRNTNRNGAIDRIALGRTSDRN